MRKIYICLIGVALVRGVMGYSPGAATVPYLWLKFGGYMVPVLLSGPAVAGSEKSLPSGWRMPTKFELSDGWRDKDRNRFALMKGDFNGDNQPDEAMLLVAEHGQLFGLFVFLSRLNGSAEKYRLDTSNDINFFASMGIAEVASGKYTTACGKGYWQCKTHELPEVHLRHPAINYFKVESAASYFYWDERRKAFRRTWMTD